MGFDPIFDQFLYTVLILNPSFIFQMGFDPIFEQFFSAALQSSQPRGAGGAGNLSLKRNIVAIYYYYYY
jgi:hypothetical protein